MKTHTAPTSTPRTPRSSAACTTLLAGAALSLLTALTSALSAQDAAPPVAPPAPVPATAPATNPPPSAVTPVAPGAQATPAPKITPTGGGETPAAGNGGEKPTGDPAAAGSKIVKAVPGRFSVQVPTGMFQFVTDLPDKNKLVAANVKATTNGVVISLLASKAAAADLDGAVEKAVAQATEHTKLPAPIQTEWTYAGHKAYRYELTTAVKDKPSVYFSYILRDDERVYIFTASVYTTHRAEFEPVFDAIAKSIAKDSSNPDAGPAAKPGSAQP